MINMPKSHVNDDDGALTTFSSRCWPSMSVGVGLPDDRLS
jgi:hypothetical protein